MDYQELLVKLDEILMEKVGADVDNLDKQLFSELTDNIEIEVVGDDNKDFIAFNRSIKYSNVKVNFKGMHAFLTENAVALGMSYDSLDKCKVALLITIDIINLVSNFCIKLNNDMLKVVYYLHDNNAYNQGISIKKVKAQTQLGSKWNIVIDDLIRYNIVKVENNTIKLLEKVLIKKKNS